MINTMVFLEFAMTGLLSFVEVFSKVKLVFTYFYESTIITNYIKI